MPQPKPITSMKILIVGGGSIGLRHARNLRSLGLSHITVLETKPEQRHKISSENFSVEAGPLEVSLTRKWDAIFICTPTQYHAEQAVQIIKASYPLFIEKPAAHSEVSEHLLKTHLSPSLTPTLVSMVGCNMRFHFGPKKVRALLVEGRIGKALFGRFYSGSYLPTWRQEVDYKKSYSAKASEGGGCLLDCIHEIDLASWVFGEISEVICHARNTETLGIQAEDMASLICFHPENVTSEIHLDYIQRTYERGCEIVGTLGSIRWEMESGQVRLYEASLDKWSIFPQPKGWELNQMYLDEVNYFLRCVIENRQTDFPMEEALKVVRTVLAAKRSSYSGKRECVVGSVEKETTTLKRVRAG